MESRLNKVKELAKENPELKDVAEDIEPLALPDAPSLTPEDLRREAVKRIDSVRDRLEHQLAKAETNPLNEMRRMLSRLQPQRGNKAASKLTAWRVPCS